MSAVPPFIFVTLGLFAAVVIGVFAIWLLIKCFAVLGMVARHIGRFVIGMFSDFFRTIGAVVLLFVLAPLAVLNVVLGRWSASAHYGRAFKNEVKTASVSVYRLIVGHPLRFLGLGLTLIQLVVILTAARIAFLLPLPGGIGTLEASQVLAFQALGFDPALGLSFSLAVRARDVLFGGIGLWWGGVLIGNRDRSDRL